VKILHKNALFLHKTLQMRLGRGTQPTQTHPVGAYGDSTLCLEAFGVSRPSPILKFWIRHCGR